jgi:acetyl esterase/lipase
LADIEAARERTRALVTSFTAPQTIAPQANHVLDIADRSIDADDSQRQIQLRVYRPRKPGRLPAVLEFHGGGFCVGDLGTGDKRARRIADLGAVVVSVDYRLAPEHPFPAGVEDCFAALTWTVQQADELQIDPARIAVAGSSAGGGLAAAVALLARDRNGPTLAFQMLSIPELDDRLETPSATAYTDTPIWDRATAALSWKYYLGGEQADQPVSLYAAPARAEKLAGLPPAFISAAQFDPLRDDALIYGQRLAQAGVPTELHLYPGTFHGSILIEQAEISRHMMRDEEDALRRALRL